MITFYPVNDPRWGDEFEFKRNIFLIARAKTDHKVFHDRNELMEFCKKYGARLDDPNNPFRISGPFNNPVLGPGTYVVHQQNLLGWLKDDLG